MTTRILIGDVRAVLNTLPSESVDCCVTSPPYWGLRSYLPADHPNKHLEIGSEPTLQQWVDTMVEVFREVRRVLRPDGTLFLNLGDAYAGSGRGGNSEAITGRGKDASVIGRGAGWREKNNASMDKALAVMPDTRNPRSVWTIPTHGFKGAHFATFPPKLAERCLVAGCPEGGTALDPFGGSGTVGMESDRQHKHAILIDIDERNGPMAAERITTDGPLFADVHYS